MRLYDISRRITPRLAVWPGDTSFSARPVLRISQGDAVNLSTLTLSAHTGAHVDAPYHVLEEGKRVGELELAAFWGPARVVDLRHVRGAIRPEHLQGVDLEDTERLLIRTSASDLPPERWPENFSYLQPETARLLVRHRLKSFGTDAPSVDPFDSKALETHRVLIAGGVAILEGLYLAAVPPGTYELVALPLKLEADGSPVRAALRTLP